LSVALYPSVEEFEDELRQILNQDRLHKVWILVGSCGYRF